MAGTGAVNLAIASAALDISQAAADHTIGGLSGVTGSQVDVGARTLTLGDATDQNHQGVISGTGWGQASGRHTDAGCGQHLQ